MISNKPIFVTQPSLPPIDEFYKSLSTIWDSRILTNNGPFHVEFEDKLKDFLGVKYISLFSNGTIALITALQALNISGEVITTPFSFVATTHALWWNNIKPVFTDIEKEYYNLDPDKVEAAITPKTTAIMPVHVYGNPCNLEKFEKIAKTHDLKLIYDAAHAFGVKYNNQSILNFGDLSILSFHATKTFNTIEGGAIVCHTAEMKKQIDYLKNFGFENETTVVAPGINGKMNELQSAYGILQLKYINNNINKRKQISQLYKEKLKDIPGISFLKENPSVVQNYSYFPIIVNKNVYGKSRDELYTKLKDENIFTRRYFYPLISQFPTYKDIESSSSSNLPNAEEISRSVLCLPIYSELDINIVIQICKFIDL